MKSTIVVFAVTLACAYGYYLSPNVQNQNQKQLFHSLGNYFHQLGAGANLPVAGSSLGKRSACANTFDESCLNGGVSSGGADEDWLNSGNTPGRR